MSDNTTLNPGAAGDVIRNVDKSGVKTQVVAVDIGGTGTESLFDGSTKGVVDDSVQNYVAGDIRPLSLTTEGRLRVSQISAYVNMEFFRTGAPAFDVPRLTSQDSPWELGEASPWP